MISLLVMVPVLGLVVWQMMKNQKRVAQAHVDLAHFTAGALASRLGMQVVEGDASFNLVVTPVASVARKVPGSAHEAEFSLQMRGQPYGRAALLRLQYSLDVGLRGTSWTWLAALTLYGNGNFPPFELYPQQAGMLAKKFSAQAMMTTIPTFWLKRMELPKQSLGSPELDARFAIQTLEPRVAGLVASALAPFHAAQHVHLVGQEGSVSYVFSQAAFNATMYHAEQILFGLAGLLAVLEGRPMPGMQSFAPAAVA